jgi:predicted transcriptional regulator
LPKYYNCRKKNKQQEKNIVSSRRLFGELEWAILQLIKQKGEASVKEIYEALNQSVVYTTVMTVMARLAEKGDLERYKKGRYYVYQLPQLAKTSSLGLVERLKQRLFGGRSLAMIRYLIDSSEDLTAQDLEEMKILLQDTKKKRKK